MSAQKPVYVEGVALEISWADQTRNLSELIFSTVTRAVEDAGQGFEGIDSVVLAAQDLVDGRSLSSMVTAPAAGAYLRDEIRFGDDGAVAFAAAVTRIEAGESERSIVAAWARASEHDVQAASRALFDPFTMTPFGLDELAVSALRAQSWIQRGGDLAAREPATQKRERASGDNPRALHRGVQRPAAPYPLAPSETPLWADVVACAVISGRPSAVRVAGMGQSSEAFSPGERKLAELTALRQASERALLEAGFAAGALDLLEVDGLCLFDEAIGMEAVGVAGPGQGLAILAQDARCNPSGGSRAGYCAPAMGLARIVEACLQLQQRAGRVQLPNVRRAMATGSAIVAGQAQTAIVLEAA